MWVFHRRFQREETPNRETRRCRFSLQHRGLGLQPMCQPTIPFRKVISGEPTMSSNQRFDKSKLPSRHVTEGPARAPHRSYYYAMGMTDEEIHQPLVGVATCWNEAAPCNIALSRQA